MYKIVETVKSTYLCADVTEEGTKIKLVDAYTIRGLEKDKYEDPKEMAKSYLRAKLVDQIKDVTLQARNVESIEDAINVSPILEIMLQYIPLAEKQAKARAVVEEMESIIGKTDDSDE